MLHTEEQTGRHLNDRSKNNKLNQLDLFQKLFKFGGHCLPDW